VHHCSLPFDQFGLSNGNMMGTFLKSVRGLFFFVASCTLLLVASADCGSDGGGGSPTGSGGGGGGTLDASLDLSPIDAPTDGVIKIDGITVSCGGANQPCCTGNRCDGGGCCVVNRCVASTAACGAIPGTCTDGSCVSTDRCGGEVGRVIWRRF
jgi:hypothetical protein